MLPLRDVQEFLLGEYAFHIFFVVEASSGNSQGLYTVFLELGEEPGCADVVCLGYFFSCDEGGISFGKFVRCAVDRGFDFVSYLIEFVLSDSDCTGSEALELDVMLFDEGVDGVTADFPDSLVSWLHNELLKQHLHLLLFIFVQGCSRLFKVVQRCQYTLPS